LLDANILADVYMALTGGQSKFEFSNNNSTLSEQKSLSENLISKDELKLVKVKADKTDLKEHEDRLADIEKLNSVETIWRKVH
jgi:DNA polymerase-3 subunit epsilon